MTSGSQENITNKNFKNISLTSLGWELALPIFGGVFLGYHIDRVLARSQYLFTVLLLILGIIIGYYNLYRLIELEMLRLKIRKNNTEDLGEK